MMHPNTLSFQPVIIIGAARSGTKLVRDVIAQHPLVDKVPYDINYLWRLGNDRLSHDELTPEMLTEKKKARITRSISIYNHVRPFLIEKTVSNCLRIPFVNDIFPTAQYIHLVRNGWDVVESSYRQWTAPLDWNYILEKGKAYPLSDAPAYATVYLTKILKRVLLGGGRKRPSSWGPRYIGIDRDIASKDLIEVCAMQWAISVEKALAGLKAISPGRVLEIRYELFVASPDEQLQRAANFLGIDPEFYLQNQQVNIDKTNEGKGLRTLSPYQQEKIFPHIHKALQRLGYL